VALEQAHVDIMQVSTFQKVQPVGNPTNALQHLERAGVARTKLPFGPRLQRLRGPMEQAQPDPITHIKLQVAVSGVVVLLGQLLRLKETLPDLSEHLIPAAE
jgi:hypothetical protein